MQEMKISDKGLEKIKQFESSSEIPYQTRLADKLDVPTIGYGTTVYPNGKKVTMQDKAITILQAEEYLRFNCNSIAQGLTKLIKTNLNQNQIDAIISFIYNIGITNFKNSTLLEYINEDPNNFDHIRNKWMEWVYSQGKIVIGLKNRRALEWLIYIS